MTTVENTKVKGRRDAAGRRVGDERWLTVDAGFNTLLEHTNYHWYYRAVVASRADEAADTPFRLAGPLCDGGDVFAGDDETPYRSFPAATAPGDVVVFFDTGAYSLELMNPYNARPTAAAYAVEAATARPIRVADTLDGLGRADVAAERAGAARRRARGAAARVAREREASRRRVRRCDGGDCPAARAVPAGGAKKRRELRVEAGHDGELEGEVAEGASVGQGAPVELGRLGEGRDGHDDLDAGAPARRDDLVAPLARRRQGEQPAPVGLRRRRGPRRAPGVRRR